jgi:PAS domain S-box-containing protein
VKLSCLFRCACGMLLLLASACPAVAQLDGLNDDWRWVEFEAHSGLSSLQLIDLTELPSGVPWIQLKDGLAWYDGFHWQSVPLDSALTGQIFRGRMSPETNDVLLVIPPELYRVSAHGATRITPLLNGTPLHVNRAFDVPGEGIMVQSDSALYLVRGRLVEFVASPFQHQRVRVPDNPYGLLRTENGAVWLNSPQGLFRWDYKKWKLWYNSPTWDWGDVQSLVENAHGDGSMSVRLKTTRAAVQWSAGRITSIEIVGATSALTIAAIAPDGSMIGSQSSGILTMYTNGQWQEIPHPPIPLLNARVLKFRSNGDLWVGKDGTLSLCRLSSHRWSTLAVSKSGAGKSVNELFLDRDSTLWVGTSDGLVVYAPDGTWKTISEVEGIKLGIVTALARDVDGNLWVASGASFTGALRWDGKHWKHFGAAEGLDDCFVHKIRADREGRLWFLMITRFAPGLHPEAERGVYSLHYGKFTHIDASAGLVDNRLYAFAEDSSGACWFGGLKGLSRLKAGVWKTWTREQGLASDKIFTLAVDRTGRLWFGHQNNGLGYIDENDKPHYITQADGITSRTIWDISVGPDDKLWVATRDGLLVNNFGMWSAIGPQQGLPIPYLWPVLATNDRVYVGTAGSGVAILNYSELGTTAPQVRFDEPVIKGATAIVSWESEAYWGGAPSIDTRVRFRLDDQPWSDWSERRTVTFAGLGTGAHVVTVQVKGLIGEVAPVPQSLTFEIQPPLVLRPLFYLPVLVLLGVAGMLATIASRRKREYDRSLRKQAARYRAVVEHQSEVILRVRPEGTITFVNESACKLFRKTREDLDGRRILELVSPDADPGNLRKLIDIREDNGASEVDHPFRNANGEISWLRWSSSIIHGDDVGIDEIQIIGRDITERRAAQENLIRSEERYRIIAEQTGQVVYEQDLASGTVTWLGAIMHVTGYPPDEFHWVDFEAWKGMIHIEDRARVLDGLATQAASGGYYQMMYRFRQKSGAYVDILDNGVVLANANGNFVRKLGTMTDVTERRHAEVMIAASLKEKEVLLKEIHHRVKNNLQVISSLLSLQAANIKDQGTLEQLRESQNRIRSMALIHERLYQSNDLARIDFDEYARNLVSFLARSYSVPGVKLSVNVQNIELSVNAAIPCGLIINELVSNALKYAFPSERTGEVEISVQPLPGNSLVLCVRDNGVGLPEDVELGKTSTLGLQLVVTLSNQLSGTIELSRENGTAISVTFPTEV